MNTWHSTAEKRMKEFYLYLDFTPRSGSPDVQSIPRVIQRLTARAFFPLGEGVYALRFPTGIGQACVIEEAESPEGLRTAAGPAVTGDESVVTRTVFSDESRVFFRVSAAPEFPGKPAVAP